MATASVVLVNSNLEDAVIAIDIAKKAFRKVRMNFFWALCYNILALPIAAGKNMNKLEEHDGFASMS